MNIRDKILGHTERDGLEERANRWVYSQMNSRVYSDIFSGIKEALAEQVGRVSILIERELK